ncbi:CRISPR-associated protein Csx3 [Candidatus Bathyarchaeota archaeon]|nr:MAG: CRISPR-associated protein Csx3 [Candidatus Bathyarchaeota archaeon]
MGWNVKFQRFFFPQYTVIYFELGGTITPHILQLVKPPKADGKRGVIISGRGPIWLHSFLAHHYHYCKWVAHHDPRLGAVVVQSHSPDREVGEIIPFDLPKELLED